MWPDRVSNPGPLTYELGALPTALRSPAGNVEVCTVKKLGKIMHYGMQAANSQYTLKRLNIGTPKVINFPFVPNGKLMIFRCPNI